MSNFQILGQPNNAPPDAVALARVFPRRNKATNDYLRVRRGML